MNGGSISRRLALPAAVLALFLCILANGLLVPFVTRQPKCRSFCQRNGDNSNIFVPCENPSRRAGRSATATKAIKHSNYDDDDTDVSNRISHNLIQGLDLIPLMEGVARHTGTFRGREALLSLVGRDRESASSSSFSFWAQANGNGGVATTLSRRKRAEGLSTPALAKRKSKGEGGGYPSSLGSVAPVASSADKARQMYELVEAASLSLSSIQDATNTALNLTYPPIYGADSSPWDTSQVEDSNRDEEWLWLPAEAWSLEDILQAEQTMQTLIRTKGWAAMEETTATWMPSLAEIGLRIDVENRLPAILDECAGRVQIVQVRPTTTLSTSSARKASYYFRLNAEKYPVLKLLRDKMDTLVERGGKELDKEVVELQMELDEVETQIRGGLAQFILSVADVIDEGLDIVARLDVIYAKAAFGQTWNGVIPQVGKGGQIYVPNFVHPVLALNNGYSNTKGTNGRDNGDPSTAATTTSRVVPIDLFLSNHENNNQRALVISGPNGGGKTLSMKSFGLVSIMVKLGIPIPVTVGSARPRVDFVDDVLLNVGDQQNLMRGESTWTSLLNSCSRMIRTVQSNHHHPHPSPQQKRYLALLDELGSGTDPDAGGAIAQAILEQLLAVSCCSVVATTHSPRLKTLSFENDDYACATVLLEMDATEVEGGEFKRPTFRLEYGVIGESYALGAASRCNPPLDKVVISRAAKLMEEGSSLLSPRSNNNDGNYYFQALTRSMEEQVQRRKMERQEAEREAQDARLCRQAMISLAASYELHLDRLNDRLEDCYRKLKEDPGKDDLELIGDVLVDIKLAKNQVMSQKELLARQGLKVLPSTYRLSVGESVVVLGSDNSAGDFWNGKTAEVVADAFTNSTLGPTEVLVRHSSSSFMVWDPEDDSIDGVKNGVEELSWIVQRHELAIWDYDSVWEEDDSYNTIGGISVMQATSIPDSKRRLNSLLSTLKSSNNGRDDVTASSSLNGAGRSQKPSKIKKSFASARARKAASGTTKKKN